MELLLLKIGTASCKNDFLQHVHNIHNVKLEVGDKYGDLFTRLKDYFSESPEKLEAANAWINLNHTEIDKDELEEFLNIEIELDGDNNTYAVFDLIN